MATEFNIINDYFTKPTSHTDLGIGDDAALISATQGQQLVVSADMSVAGTHFEKHAEPYDIGWKSLAVNLSDMAAMGATPRWATLAIALPNINETWLKEFSRGFFACAKAFSVDIIGGDTTKGPLNIAVQIIGEVPIGKALTRNGAKAGDDIWVSGHIGSAALGLAALKSPQILLEDETLFACLKALNIPQPRVKLGLALRDIASSCIDVSDGLLADLSHILNASSLGTTIQLNKIPCLPLLRKRMDKTSVQRAILAGGDDYELCFTASPAHRENIVKLSQSLQLPITLISQTSPEQKLEIYFDDKQLDVTQLGYEHFAETT